MTIFVIVMGVAMQVAGMMASERATKEVEHLSIVRTAFSLGEKNLCSRKPCSKENVKSDEFGEKLNLFNEHIARAQQCFLMEYLKYEIDKQNQLNDHGESGAVMKLSEIESNALFMEKLKEMTDVLCIQEPTMEASVQKCKEAGEKLAATVAALKKIEGIVKELVEEKNKKNEETMEWEVEVLSGGSVVPFATVQQTKQDNGKVSLAKKTKKIRKRKGEKKGLINLCDLSYEKHPLANFYPSKLETLEGKTELIRRSTRPSKKPKYIRNKLPFTVRSQSKTITKEKKRFEIGYGPIK